MSYFGRLARLRESEKGDCTQSDVTTLLFSLSTFSKKNHIHATKTKILGARVLTLGNLTPGRLPVEVFLG